MNTLKSNFQPKNWQDKISKNLNDLKWVNWFTQMVNLFWTDLATIEKNVKKFKEDFITIDSNWDYVVTLKDPESDDFDFQTDLNLFTAIPMALSLSLIEDGKLWEKLSDLPIWYIDSLLEKIQLSIPSADIVNDAKTELERVWLEGLFDEYYSDDQYLCIPDGYDPKAFMPLFQIAYRNRYIGDTQKENLFAQNSMNDYEEISSWMFDDLENAVRWGNKSFEVISDEEDENDSSDLLRLFVSNEGNTISVESLNKNYEIDSSECINDTAEWKLFKSKIGISNVMARLVYSESVMWMQTFQMSATWSDSDFYLDMTVYFNTSDWFSITPELDMQMEIEVWEKEENNIKILELFSGVETINDLKTTTIQNKDNIISLKWQRCYDELFWQIKLFSDIEKNPEKYIWTITE